MENSLRSFRDPAGRLHFIGSKPVRQVRADHAATYRELVRSPLLTRLMEAGSLVRTEVVDNPRSAFTTAELGHLQPADDDLLLVHEKIPFPSFPAEWPPEMHRAAGYLTLEIAEQALEYGLGLKDATPYNILFKGHRPVFVDILSFERRDRHDPIWLAYGQFVRTVIFPLLAHTHLHFPLAAAFLTRRDGLEPADLYRMLSPLRRLLPPFLGSVSLPTWLSRRAETRSSTYRPQSIGNEQKALFILRSHLRRMRRMLDRTKARSSEGSHWIDYCRSCTYDEKAFSVKSGFVGRFLADAAPRRVLDVGCNTGHFSRLAASAGAQVVAIDSDAAVVGALWSLAAGKGLDILPLVVDFARPTPALGWRNGETPSFLDRAKGYFDAVFMLAVLHHLIVTDQIPLREVMRLAAEVTTRYLVIEYVSPDDPQFRRLARGRDELYRHVTREYFEAAAAEFFRINETHKIEGQERWLYVMEKRNDR